jgi:hypothetical protein
MAKGLALVALVAFIAPSAARAEDPQNELSAAEEESLTRDRGWPAGTIQHQLDKDSTLIPYGKGALFVPAMTNPLDEPTIAVVKNGQVVAEGTTGARIALVPGTYQVRLGSGADEQRLDVQATVREKHTTVVPVSWAGLQVHVVDEQYGSLRGSYELIRVADREYIGIGFGTDELAGEPVSTWVVRPGLYKIVRVGENYRARKNFATVRLEEGNLTHFLLVLNKDTLDFSGGGEVPEIELFKPREGFFGSLVLGGDFSASTRSNVLGQANGLGFAVHAFFDARMSLEILNNPLVLFLQIEEGQAKTPDLPWQKSNDRAHLDALYVFKVASWIGPYVRGSGETNLVPGRAFFSTPTEVVYFAPDGATVLRTDTATDRALLSPPLGLTTVKEGVGMNVRLFKTLFAETTLRSGLGGRHRFTHNLYTQIGMPNSTTVQLEQVTSSNLAGIEATVLATGRLTQYVVLNLQLDSLFPFEGLSQTVLELVGSVAIKLTSLASINYVLHYLHDPSIPVTPEVIQQDLLLRFSLELL